RSTRSSLSAHTGTAGGRRDAVPFGSSRYAVRSAILPDAALHVIEVVSSGAIHQTRGLFRTAHFQRRSVMRAAVMRNLKIVTDDMPEPVPGPGEVLVKTLACGICGSDLHALKHAKQFVENAPGGMGMDIGRDVVMGHEF